MDVCDKQMSRVTICHSVPWRRAPGQRQEVVKCDTFKMNFVARLLLTSVWLGGDTLGWKDMQFSCGVWGGYRVGEANKNRTRILPSSKDSRLLWEECLCGTRSSGMFLLCKRISCSILTTVPILHLPQSYFLRIHSIDT